MDFDCNPTPTRVGTRRTHQTTNYGGEYVSNEENGETATTGHT